MIKKIKKILKKLNNRGSSIVLVIAAVGFIGILVGALLAAVGYAYKLKLYDLNARDNFYYVEQAMEDIYAGVGSKTLEHMREAYSYTVENMTYYDLSESSYVSMSDDAANEMFKRKFMELLASDSFFSGTNIADELEQFITNSSVTLDKAEIVVKQEVNPLDNSDVIKVSIKNVALTRSVNYEHSRANGQFMQRIVADIDISKPDFLVDFNSLFFDYSTIFDFAVVADMGVEVNQDPSKVLTISGNVYAASDYYNKDYNNSYTVSAGADSPRKFAKTYGTEAIEISYEHDNVSSKQYTSETVNDLYNASDFIKSGGIYSYYDGVNQKSMYSGLLVNGSKVSILADTVIVPGTIAVLNSGDMDIYTKEGRAVSQSSIWTDNIVLDGYSIRTSAANAADPTYKGASAVLRANVFVKDDLEINSNYSLFVLSGGYYGFSNSTKKDDRTFVKTVDPSNFQIEYDDKGTTVVENRGHYNSSAIIVNGENSELDLQGTKKIFLAGRTYIELSKEINEATTTIGAGADKQDVVSDTYSFIGEGKDLMSSDPDAKTSLRDYKTGESISTKTTQVAYIPIMLTGTPKIGTIDGTEYFLATINPSVAGSDLFVDHFGASLISKGIPTIMQEINGRKHYYYDFQAVWDINSNGTDGTNYVSLYSSADELAKSFIYSYVSELNDVNSSVREYLIDIGNYEDFEASDILLPTSITTGAATPGSFTYSSGAITAKSGTSFDMIVEDTDAVSALLTTDGFNNINSTDVFTLSNDLTAKYNFIKWNLGEASGSTYEDEYINDLASNSSFGESYITPINRYMNFSKIVSSTSIRPKFVSSDTGSGILDLKSGYQVWVDYNDVTIKAKDDAKGIVRGIVISKGDVFFDANVTQFEGIIICGGKVYINNNLTTMNASAEIIKAILKECKTMGSDDAKYILELFKFYSADSGDAFDTGSTTRKTADTLNYSDVIGYSNWMKNVE